MPVPHRPRRLVAAALLALFAVLLLAGDASAQTQYPNSVFTRFTEFNRDVGYLFKIILIIGTLVFIFVESLLLYTIFRYKRKSENERPKHVHGNTTLEVMWTAIPAIILAFIAVPTVKTIFKTQAVASADALQVQVIGHQWWWEFRYPQYTAPGANGKLDTLTTANELYMPVGRKVNFALSTYDVLHSFWIPQMGGKRDLISNRVNYLWFTPDSVGSGAWNGFCAEFCGTSHGNMHFKAFTVTPAEFASWTQHQMSMGAMSTMAAPAPATAVATITNAGADSSKGKAVQNPSEAHLPGPAAVAAATTSSTNGTTGPVGGAPMAGHDMASMPVQQASFISYPREKIPPHVIPATPIPDGVTYNDALQGDAERGRALLTAGQGACLGCHVIHGNPVMMGQIGPNLTHVATRTTIAGGIYPNDTKHLTRWIKNARVMKPGVIMPTIGAGQWDPVVKAYIPKTGLSDQQIADVVAYLQALK